MEDEVLRKSSVVNPLKTFNSYDYLTSGKLADFQKFLFVLINISTYMYTFFYEHILKN